MIQIHARSAHLRRAQVKGHTRAQTRFFKNQRNAASGQRFAVIARIGFQIGSQSKNLTDFFRRQVIDGNLVFQCLRGVSLNKVGLAASLPNSRFFVIPIRIGQAGSLPGPRRNKARIIGKRFPASKSLQSCADNFATLLARFLTEKIPSSGFTAKNRWSVRKTSVYNARVVRIVTSQQFLHLAAAAFLPRNFSGSKIRPVSPPPPNVESFCFLAAYANAPEQKLDQNIIEPGTGSARDWFLLSLCFLISQTEAMLIVRGRAGTFYKHPGF